MIPDYSTYLTETGAYGLNSETVNRNLFFHDWDCCKYCSGKLENVFGKGLIDTKTLNDCNWHKSEGVVKCVSCNWWQHTFYSYLDGEQSWGFKDWEIEVNNAILRKFKVNSNEVPILSLRAYLAEQNDKVFKIHHTKMEELVASVFREHYACEVELVGKTGDGGVDLIMIKSDNPIMIQVKRRKTPKVTEPVKEIRDLIGATLLKDSRNCAFVTTADHFSEEAKEASETAITKSIVDTFELYDYKRFFDILNSVKIDDCVNFKDLLKLRNE